MSIKRRFLRDGTIDYLRDNATGIIVEWDNALGCGLVVEDYNGKRYLFRASDRCPNVGQRVTFVAVDSVKGGKLASREAEGVCLHSPLLNNRQTTESEKDYEGNYYQIHQ